MACTNPMLMSVIDFRLNKDYSKICLSLKRHGYKINFDDHKAYRLVSKSSREHLLEAIPEYCSNSVIEVPCGNCISCRIAYSRDWANRCTLEAKKYQHNYFVTLTYDDEKLPKGSIGNPTLVKEHFGQFIKSLRTKFKRELGHDGIKFFGCGEYGDLYGRPHLHIILFNCPIPDLTIDFDDGEGHIIHKKNKMGTYMYYSQFIKDLWQYGFITIDDANYNTEAYVSRYVLKKQKGQDSKIYRQLGILPPFVRMSNGIAKTELTDNFTDYIDDPHLYVSRPSKNPSITGLPRYYKKIIKKEDKKAYQKMVDNSIDNIKAGRSLLAGKRLINDNRAAQESRIISKNKAFHRNCE